MKRSHSRSAELTYPLRTATRLTGLSPDLLRAWEKRYGIVVPLRTAGGTRRYTAADVERLRVVKMLVDAGHRVGQLASFDDSELKRLSLENRNAPPAPVSDLFAVLENFDVVEFQRLLSIQFSILGAARFAYEVGVPLLVEIGDRWARGDMGVAQEHLASGVIRSLIGSALQPTAMSVGGPRILFATPSSERHELGLLMAALISLGAGAHPFYLGSDLPLVDIVDAARRTEARAVALSIVTLRISAANKVIEQLRSSLGDDVHLWIGGAAAADVVSRVDVEFIASLEALEHRVMLLRLTNTSS